MSGKKILVADDSLTIQKVIRLALSTDGYDIATVSDGDEAIEQASLVHPDVCIIDISLPKKDAYQIRENFLSRPDLKDIPIIMMSSTFEKLDEDKYQSLEFAGHLIKPFDPAHLRSTLLNVLKQSPSKNPTAAAIDSVLDDAGYEPDEREISTGEIRSVLNDLPKLEDTLSGTEENTPSLDAFWDEPKTNSFETTKITSTSTFSFSGPELTPKTAIHSSAKISSPFEESPKSNDPIVAMMSDTVKLSGMDEGGWGVVEPGKSPFAKPTQSSTSSSSHSSAKLNTKPVTSSKPATASTQATTSFDSFTSDLSDDVSNKLSKDHGLSAGAGIDEGMLRGEVRAAIRETVRELAEKIIREEIAKLLSNQPQ